MRRAPQAGLGAVEPQAEAEAAGVERDRALRVGRADHDMIEAGDRCSFLGLGQGRGRARIHLGAERDRDAMCGRALDLQRAIGLARRQRPLRQQPLRLVHVIDRERKRRQALAPAVECLQRKAHVAELEDARTVVGLHTAPAQEQGIVLRGGVHGRNGDGDVVEAGDHATVPPFYAEDGQAYHEQPDQGQAPTQSKRRQLAAAKRARDDGSKRGPT